MVLVTGASGHVGNVLVRALLREGEAVRALLLPGDPAPALDGLDVERVTGDLLDADALDRAVDGAGVVYHVAGLVALSAGNLDGLMRVNVEGTHRVIAACLRAGVRRLVYTSSVHALARSRGDEVLTGVEGFDADRAEGPYGRSKALASAAVLEAARDGLEAVVLCPTGVIGPYDFVPSLFGRFLRAYLGGRIRAAVRGGFDYVDVRDVAEAHVRAARTAPSGGSHVVCGEYVTMPDMLAALAGITGVRAPRVVLPWRLARGLASVSSAAMRLVGRRAMADPDSLDVLRVGVRYSAERLRAELGVAPRPVRDSLADAVRWMQRDAAGRPFLEWFDNTGVSG